MNKRNRNDDEVRNEYIANRWGQLYELEKSAVEVVYRYLFFVNSGGAVAVLGYLGNAEEARGLIGMQVSLAGFVFGIIFLGVTYAIQVHNLGAIFESFKNDVSKYQRNRLSYEKLNENDFNKSKVHLIDYVVPYTSAVCFLVGCSAGAYSFFS